MSLTKNLDIEKLQALNHPLVNYLINLLKEYGEDINTYRSLARESNEIDDKNYYLQNADYKIGSKVAIMRVLSQIEKNGI